MSGFKPFSSVKTMIWPTENLKCLMLGGRKWGVGEGGGEELLRWREDVEVLI